MRNLLRVGVVAMIGLMLVAPGCEDTDPTAPSDGEIKITASPGTVVIDVQQGETTGETTIAAQVFSSSGFAVSGVHVAFTTTGGKMATSDNSCQTAGTCRISGEACTVNSDCPAVVPETIVTNSNGVAIDVLTLDLNDPTSVDVTAFSGILSAAATVTKTVTDGNVQPTAEIIDDPAGIQEIEVPVTFDGRNSSDPDGVITCYQWTIDSSIDSNDSVLQGPSLSLITAKYFLEQTMTVTLRVSDEPDAATFCPSGGNADPSYFSPNSDFITYEIACDRFGPTANAGPNQTVPLNLNSAPVDVELNAGQSSGGETSPIESYEWVCGNGAESQDTAVATCTYSRTGTFTASVTITNDCGETDTDDVIVTITESAQPTP